METFLIDSWLGELEAIDVEDVASVSLVREAVRAIGARAGLPVAVGAAMATVASELAHNQLAHGRRGAIAATLVERDGVAGIEVIAADVGTGIADPKRALAGRGSNSSGLGIGVAGVRSLSDEIDVDVRRGEGTCVRARKFARAVRRRREVGIFGRPHVAERVSGDGAAFLRRDDALVVGVVDGLGHGPEARAAAMAAIRCFGENATRASDEVIAACHTAIARTRGGVMAVASIAEPSGVMTTTSAGNVSTCVCGRGQVRRYAGVPFVLGSPGKLRKLRVDRDELDSIEALLLHSDGISARATLDGRLDLLREHPVVVAQTIVAELAREDDDAIVLVAR